MTDTSKEATWKCPVDIEDRAESLGVEVNDGMNAGEFIRAILSRAEHEYERGYASGHKARSTEVVGLVERAEKAEARLEREGHQHTRAIIAERQRDNLRARVAALEGAARDVVVYADAPMTHEMDDGEAGVVCAWDVLDTLRRVVNEHAVPATCNDPLQVGEVKESLTTAAADVLAERVLEKRIPLGVRAAAKEAGVSPATLSRVENGGMPGGLTLLRLCTWIGADPRCFMADLERLDRAAANNKTED